MKSSKIFVLVFIGVLFALVHGTSTEGVTNDVTTGPVTQAGETTTVQSGNSDSPTGTTDAPATTDGSATGGSSETNAPQTTAAPTTAAPSCPTEDIVFVKDSGTQDFIVNIQPGLNCSYYARSTSFSKSIIIKDPVSFVVSGGGEATLKIFGDNGADSCQSPDPCLPHGTCQVIQGQETCVCAECYIGTKCDIELDPCASYQLVCNTKQPPQQCHKSSPGCTPTCQ
uniref:EGF-like domain-containing protein n=1 Tax=Panagrolaimus superbus TaxID=310955 RepID=A0A914Z3I6_9BILA